MVEFLLFAILFVLLIAFLPGLLEGILVIGICLSVALVVFLLFGQQSWFWLALGTATCLLIMSKVSTAVIHANRMKDFVAWCEELPDRLAPLGIKAWLYRSGDKPQVIFVDNTANIVAKKTPFAFFYCRDGEMHKELIAIEEEVRTWQKNLNLPAPTYSTWVFGEASSMNHYAKSAMPTREREGGRTALIHNNYVFLALMK